MLNEEILQTFHQALPHLDSARRLVHENAEALFSASNLKIQQVSSRVKSQSSLEGKISRPDKTYHSLWELTDLFGLRVITYFEDTIDEVAKLIEKHFVVDFSHSTNKLHFRDHGTFGYRSLHYACALTEELRSMFKLPEEFRFEIQVRTVLQHAWAEIEHDLGYKAQDSIPEAIRRRFSRVASLLEIADDEFGAIRSELANYSSTVSSGSLDGEDIPLDRVSLSLLASTPEVRELDLEIAAHVKKELITELFYPEYLLKMLKLSGVRTLGELRSALHAKSSQILDIITPYFDFTQKAWNLSSSNLNAIHTGYSLFFLAHLLVLETPSLGVNKVGRLTHFYRELDYPHDERTAAKVAAELYDRIKGVTATKL